MSAHRFLLTLDAALWAAAFVAAAWLIRSSISETRAPRWAQVLAGTAFVAAVTLAQWNVGR